MKEDKNVLEFLSGYDPLVYNTALNLREIIAASLPNVIEQVDLPARMVAYCYGQKYVEMICAVFPSKKGIKLSFYKGIDLPDPENILRGTAKLSRYVEMKNDDEINTTAIKGLLKEGLKAYKLRMK